MPPTDTNLLDAVLDSWARNNTILVNLLHLIPEGGLDVRGAEGSPSVARMFIHMHYVRLVFEQAGISIPDTAASRVTWGVRMSKTP